MKSYTVTIWVDRGDEVDIELEITGMVFDYFPAVTHLAFENCHPAEGGEVEIQSVKLDGQEWDGELTETERDKAEEKLFEAAQDDDFGWADDSDDLDLDDIDYYP